jgi:integrase
MPIKEVKVPNFPQLYRLMEVKPDGKQTATNSFRVRKRIKTNGLWTTRVATFDNFEEAKHYAKYGKVSSFEQSQRSDSFADVFQRFLKHKELKENVAESSLDGYRNRARHFSFFETFKTSQITPRTIDSWLDLLFSKEYMELQQRTRVSYEHEYFLLSGVLNYYRNYENEDFKNPLLERHREIACKRSKENKSKEIRFLSESLENKFLGFLSKSESNSVMRDIALFQLHTGARIGEAAALEFRNIDFSESEVVLSQHLHWERKSGAKTLVVKGTKGGPSRIIPLTQECKDMLIRRFNATKSNIVFELPNSGWLTYRTIQSRYDRCFRKMEIPHRGTHTLRHTFAVRYLDNSKDIHALQKLLGHSDLKDTQRYAKYTYESVKRSFQSFRGGWQREEDH